VAGDLVNLVKTTIRKSCTSSQKQPNQPFNECSPHFFIGGVVLNSFLTASKYPDLHYETSGLMSLQQEESHQDLGIRAIHWKDFETVLQILKPSQAIASGFDIKKYVIDWDDLGG
jgi:hypothetical protein